MLRWQPRNPDKKNTHQEGKKFAIQSFPIFCKARYNTKLSLWKKVLAKLGEVLFRGISHFHLFFFKKKELSFSALLLCLLYKVAIYIVVVQDSIYQLLLHLYKYKFPIFIKINASSMSCLSFFLPPLHFLGSSNNLANRSERERKLEQLLLS